MKLNKLLFLFFLGGLLFFLCNNAYAQKTQRIDKWFAKGQYFQNNENPGKAVKFYSKIIRKDPVHFLAINNRALCYNTLGELKKALNEYDKLIQIDSLQGMIYLNRGLTYRKMEQYEKAMADYIRAKDMQGTRLDLLYYNMGINAIYAYNNNDSGIYYYNKAILENPGFRDAYANKAYAYFRMQQWDKAGEQYKLAFQLGKGSALQYNNWAYCFIKQNNFEQALSILNTSLKLYPKNPWCHRNLGILHKEKGEKQLACKHLQLALDQDFLKKWKQVNIQDLLDYCNE